MAHSFNILLSLSVLGEYFFCKILDGGTYADSNLRDFRGEYNKSENDKFEIFEGGTYGDVYGINFFLFFAIIYIIFSFNKFNWFFPVFIFATFSTFLSFLFCTFSF